MFKFGDIVENGWASEANPTRRGFVVRTANRTGKMNAGPYVEMTDGEGKFWECPITKDHKLIKVGEIGRRPVDAERLNPKISERP